MMIDVTFSTRRRTRLLAVSLAALMVALPARAQQAPAPSTPSLLEEMVATGVITQAQADKILKGARARDAAKAAQAGTAPQATAAAPPAQQGVPTGAAGDGAVHVQYVPQIVRDQLKDEVRREVMAQAKDEGWAAPNQVPDWVNRVKISGDVRVRSEEDLFPKGNAIGAGEQINFNALNNRSTPIDANQANISNGGAISNAVPYDNVNEDRERERLRARLAVDADLGEGFTSGIRLATGSDSQPVSTNQTLGGSGGNFSKYQMWLDRAFIKYEPFNSETAGMSATVGRFANPFFSTDLVWNNDLNMDGFAASGRYQVAQGVTPFATIGAFPVFNSALDFSTYDTTKTASQDRWLYAAQGGTDWKATKDTAVKVGAAYYDFENIAGRQTTCYYADQTCGSDLFRPTFAQHGNTYMRLRNNVGSINPGVDPDYQYYGLASGFHELALTGRVDYDGLKPIFRAQPFRVSLDGEFVDNLAFDKATIAGKSPENNLAGKVCATNDSACLADTTPGAFNGGNTGYMARLTVGSPALTQRWDWNVSLAYKYVESDAVVDAFTDSDFGMGGTNLKGYILGGNLALARNVWTTLRWMSADSISGAPYSEDTVMLDLNAKF